MLEMEIRCGRCNRLLAKGQAGDITIKCPRCATMNRIMNQVRAESPDREFRENPLERQDDTNRQRGTVPW